MNFSFLKKSIGRTVQLERGGPDKVIGELVAIHSDYIVLRNQEHGVLYCATQHIKSVSMPILEELALDQTESSEDISTKIPTLEEEDFNTLLQQLKHSLIKVNHSGPNTLKGVLIDINEDAITVVHDMKDYVHFPIFHIRTVSRVYNVANNKNNDNDKDKDEGNKKQEIVYVPYQQLGSNHSRQQAENKVKSSKRTGAK